jgi:hypothetical protein
MLSVIRLNIVMLYDEMLSVILMNDVMLSVMMQTVVTPKLYPYIDNQPDTKTVSSQLSSKH